MGTGCYLLRRHIEGDGPQVHLGVRLDAGQHEKEAYEYARMGKLSAILSLIVRNRIVE